MLFKKADSVYAKKNYLLWFSLSFQAGMVNSGAYLALHRFVSHITGFATHFGVDLTNHELGAAISSASVPLVFLLGSMISAYFIDRKRHEGMVPSYFGIFSLIALCFFLAGYLGLHNYFGKFGDQIEVDKDFLLMSLITLGCGLQNAVVTSVSHAIIRTTHLTGITTDLGIGLTRILFKSAEQDQLKKEKSATIIRVSIILGFICGSIFGAFLFLKFQYIGFFFPSFVSLLIGAIIHFKIQYNLKHNHFS